MSNALVVKSEQAATLAPAIQPFSPEALIATAIDRGMPLETLEKLLAMRDKLKAERAREAFFGALSAFQSECPVIEKKQAVKNKDGKSDRYKYAGLGDILKVVGPLLHRHHLSYRLVTEHKPGPPPFMISTCTVHHADGHSEASTFPVPLVMSGHMNAAQEYGSARTYASRYAFCDAFGIMTCDEDDDGNSLDPPKPVPPAMKPQNGHAEAPGRQLPRNGVELYQRLKALEDGLVAEKKCKPAALLTHVREAGLNQGYSDDLSRWDDPEQIAFAVDAVKAFLAKPAAPAPDPDGVKLSNWLREQGKRLHAEGGCTNEDDLLMHLRAHGKAQGWGDDPIKWRGPQLEAGETEAGRWLAEQWERVRAQGEPVEGEVVSA